MITQHANPEPSCPNWVHVGQKVQRLEGEATRANNPSTSAQPRKGDDIVRHSAGNSESRNLNLSCVTDAQISKIETLRSELTFGQVLRGLQVYGYQVVDGKAIVEARVTPNS